MEAVRRARRLAWSAVKLEVTLYLALGRWIARRRDVPPGTVPIGYSQLVTPMLMLWIFGSAVEVVVLDDGPVLGMLLAAPRLFLGGIERISGYRRLSVTRLVIRGEGKIASHRDGDPEPHAETIEILRRRLDK